MKAHEILEAAAGHLKDRASTYDKPEGERSMYATVEAFECVTGVGMTETQGWLFMAILKAVRSQQGGYRADSYEDGAAYFSLAGEAAAFNTALDGPENESVESFRARSIDKIIHRKVPEWSRAPLWAQWLAQDANGDWYWFDYQQPQIGENYGQWETDGEDVIRASAGAINPNWKSTLQKRPATEYDWIDWAGGECPLPDGTICEIMFVDGCTVVLSALNNLRWIPNGGAGDIIKYRITESPCQA